MQTIAIQTSGTTFGVKGDACVTLYFKPETRGLSADVVRYAIRISGNELYKLRDTRPQGVDHYDWSERTKSMYLTYMPRFSDPRNAKFLSIDDLTAYAQKVCDIIESHLTESIEPVRVELLLRKKMGQAHVRRRRGEQPEGWEAYGEVHTRDRDNPYLKPTPFWESHWARHDSLTKLIPDLTAVDEAWVESFYKEASEQVNDEMAFQEGAEKLRAMAEEKKLRLSYDIDHDARTGTYTLLPAAYNQPMNPKVDIVFLSGTNLLEQVNALNMETVCTMLGQDKVLADQEKANERAAQAKTVENRKIREAKKAGEEAWKKLVIEAEVTNKLITQRKV